MHLCVCQTLHLCTGQSKTSLATQSTSASQCTLKALTSRDLSGDIPENKLSIEKSQTCLKVKRGSVILQCNHHEAPDEQNKCYHPIYSL